LAQRSYPISIDLPRIATASEALIRNELLLRHPDDLWKGYQFRMDIWRLWVRRSHSVWRVIQERGVPTRKRWYQRVALRIAAMAIVPLVLVWGGFQMMSQSPPADDQVDLPPASLPAKLDLEVTPDDAAIFLDERRRGTGMLVGVPLESNRPYGFRLTANGYHDSTFTLEFAPGDQRTLSVNLRPGIGSILVESTPPGAVVSVDGTRRGTSPLTISDLFVTTPPSIVVSSDGYHSEERSVRVISDTTVTAVFQLERREFTVTLSTSPSGAAIAVDGVVLAERAPSTISMTEDQHRIVVTLDGHVPVDTVLTVLDNTSVHFRMLRVPQGVFVAKGVQIASVYVDGELVSRDRYNSGPHPLAPGLHEISVVLPGGATIDTTVAVPSSRVTEYNFTEGTISRRDTTLTE
jgi:hypothetical protein